MSIKKFYALLLATFVLTKYHGILCKKCYREEFDEVQSITKMESRKEINS